MCLCLTQYSLSAEHTASPHRNWSCGLLCYLKACMGKKGLWGQKEYMLQTNIHAGGEGESIYSSDNDCRSTRAHRHTPWLSATSQSHSVTQCWYSVWSWQLSFNWPGWCSMGRCHAAGSLRGCGTGPTVGAVKRPAVSTGTPTVGVPPHLGVHRQSAN